MSTIYEKQEEAKRMVEERSKKCADKMVAGLLAVISSTPSHEGLISKNELNTTACYSFDCWDVCLSKPQQQLPFSEISKEMRKHMSFVETPEGFEWKVSKN